MADLTRSMSTLLAITAAFNLNLLQRAKAELGADFILERFRHEAIYDRAHSRIEMRLVSRCQHQVVVVGERFEFGEGERITTEYSYKYRMETFHELAAAGGWQIERTWTDKKRWFSVNYFTSKQKGD
jgi:L-histidine Nalpha-methyltransferase